MIKFKEINMKENMEQPEIKINGSNEFGKFNSVESLLKAYNSLEAEFTKKSQKLASIESENIKTQNELNKKAEQEKKVEEFVSKFEIVKPFKGALKESLAQSEETDIKEEAIRLISKSYKTAQDFSQDEEFLNNYVFSIRRMIPCFSFLMTEILSIGKSLVIRFCN